MEGIKINPAWKAALLSAFLFPGAGHLFLHKYQRGAAFITSTLASLFALALYIVYVAQEALISSPLKKADFNFKAFLALTADVAKSLNVAYIALFLLLIAFLWALSVLDAHRLGQKEPS